MQLHMIVIAIQIISVLFFLVNISIDSGGGILALFGDGGTAQQHPGEHHHHQRVCANFFRCIPHLLTINFGGIADASRYYTSTLLVTSELTPEEFAHHMSIIEGICHNWLAWDNCMDRDWSHCVDFEQAINLIGLVSGHLNSAGMSIVKFDRQEANRFFARGVEHHWTDKSLRDAMDVAAYACRNLKRLIPKIICGRDLLLSNETVMNVTLRWRALMEARCLGVEDPLDCYKPKILSHIIGHYLYHGCRDQIDDFVDMFRFVFVTVPSISNNADCRAIFENKTAKELFEAPPPEEYIYHFGDPDDIQRCNWDAFNYHQTAMYEGTVTQYLANRNMTKDEFIAMIWDRHPEWGPHPTLQNKTTTTTTTTTATSSLLPDDETTATTTTTMMMNDDNDDKIEAPQATANNIHQTAQSYYDAANDDDDHHHPEHNNDNGDGDAESVGDFDASTASTLTAISTCLPMMMIIIIIYHC